MLTGRQQSLVSIPENFQQPTFNVQHPTITQSLDVGYWVFDVECSKNESGEL